MLIPARGAIRDHPAKYRVKVISSEMPVTYWKERLKWWFSARKQVIIPKAGCIRLPIGTLPKCSRDSDARILRCCTLNSVEAAKQVRITVLNH